MSIDDIYKNSSDYKLEQLTRNLHDALAALATYRVICIYKDEIEVRVDEVLEVMEKSINELINNQGDGDKKEKESE